MAYGIQVWRKYRTIFAICLQERLTYRTDFLIGTMMRFLPIVTTIFLWTAVFAGSPYERIAGLSKREMVAYYLLTMVARAFSSMPRLSRGMAGDIRDGQIKKYLLQPVNLVGFNLVARMAHKLVYYGVALGPFALVFWLCRHFFDGWPPWPVLAAFIASLLLGFLIGFLFELWLGLLAFWFLEISSFIYIFMTLNYLLSGHMFPLGLVPGWLGTVLRHLPFQYLAYYPAMLFLHGSSMTGGALVRGILVEAGYALGLALLVWFTYKRGTRHYSAFGG